MTKTGYPVLYNTLLPVVVSTGVWLTAAGAVFYFHGDSCAGAFRGLGVIALAMVMWWFKVAAEAAKQSGHSSLVYRNERIAMALFILSEAFFFVSFFWALGHFKIGEISYGYAWPPVGISVVDAFKVPLLNLIILLCSGATAQASLGHVKAHNQSYPETKEMDEHLLKAVVGLLITVVLGFLFLGVQAWEYVMCQFAISDSAFGSVFFVVTGFHGSHVLIGALFFVVAIFRLLCGHFKKGSNYFHMWAAVWYWHFVDVIWVFLFVALYWGANS
uniref:cytochrome c oxidase subunit III n=1 Tax=Neoteredo reynei TaxID=298172 RepID=UPI0020286EC9|nr:cytochrome c oxidase subunit III [Neoteredo reynei]UPX89273.1 cytochrome c oxidase subunit 3 [Neoteredo reynei]